MKERRYGLVLLVFKYLIDPKRGCRFLKIEEIPKRAYENKRF